jgi:hypothetical protein
LNILVDISAAAFGNTTKARCREACRMLMLCWCLKQLGVNAVATGSIRISDDRIDKFFRPLFGRMLQPDVLVIPFEHVGYYLHWKCPLVGFKTSVDTTKDKDFLSHVAVLMCHEYDDSLAENPKLLPIPFPVHDVALQYFQSQNWMERYLLDDISFFRDFYCTSNDMPGFFGFGGYGRMNKLATHRHWCDIETYESPPVPTHVYLRRVGSWSAGFCPAGSTPKANRFSELALLGKPIIIERTTRKVMPPLGDHNAILIDDWNDAEYIQTRLQDRDSIALQADNAYLAGWSPIGNAKLLMERLCTIRS